MMNPELKALVKMAIDGVAAGKAAVEKKDFVTGILPKLYSVVSDIPAVASSIGDLKAELEGLKDAQNDADLIAYVVANLAGVTEDAKAQAVIAAVAVAAGHVVGDVIAIKAAIQA